MEQVQSLVSVIIPTYNRAQLCRQAVESVLSQTYRNIEAIVVDDGSSDNTREIVASLGPRVRYLHQENSGVSAARNLGIHCARGEFIAFLDSDDSWLPWKLDAQIAVLRRFPTAGMVWTDMVAVDASGREIHPAYLRHMYSAYARFDHAVHFRETLPLGEIWDHCPAQWLDKRCYLGNIFTWMFSGNLVHTSTVVLRRSRIESVGLFDVSLIKTGEDYDFHFRTTRAGDVAFVDVASIHYRIGAADQLTSSDLAACMARNDLRTITKMVGMARSEIQLPDRSIRRRFARSHAWIGREELLLDTTSARNHFLQSLKLQPFQTKTAALWLLSLLPTHVILVLRDLKRALIGPRSITH